ncbi:right-handed parallel beta-helix repeat-containing protein [Stieleria sp. TO1_6]|uniref:right-handed parallel beta-helix repeat-containing protein n=1 Tax=Stieleria tagensis TaxID=2956795 RepID=UPI00209B58A2|nr:right-handed parallel beta-helix repeat-containing protein [Stieleria tagensis]MCO8123193.1 right-handed parallel beta-helix repeat-containing protein [Stieleria tagensis]
MFRICFPAIYLFAAVGTLLSVTQAAAKQILLSPDSNWFEVLAGDAVDPGDQIVLAAGTYSDRRLLTISLRGTADAPIIIRAATGQQVVFKRPDARQNSINLVGCQFLVLRGIEITGGDSGIRISGSDDHPAKFITLEDLHIHHINGVAVTANAAGQIYESLTFRRNHIHHTGGHGEGFYLGSNNTADGRINGYIFNSVIENNYIHDLRGSNVSQGDGIELKDGCYGNFVRDNVIHSTGYPGIIVYSSGGKAANIIERNVIWDSADHGIQAASDAVVRNNIIYDVKGFGIYSRNHQNANVGRLQLVHNTIINDRAIRIIAPQQFSGPVVVANNAVSGEQRIPQAAEIISRSNTTAIIGFFPQAGSKCIGSADPQFVPQDDFNGTPRGDTRDTGAYRYAPTGNPGWTVAAEFKKAIPSR